MAGSAAWFWKSALLEAMTLSDPFAWMDRGRVLRKTVAALPDITICWKFSRTRTMSDMWKCGSGQEKISIPMSFLMTL
jgi:hypothetical protein